MITDLLPMATNIPFTACQNKNLLVVDDSVDNREFVVDLLLQMAPSINVLVAKSGKHALQILEKKPIHIILLDWEMPEMTGLELLQLLQQNAVYQQIPVVMYTGAMTATHDLSQALSCGAIDFLRKPADPIELLARLDSILRQKEAEQARKHAEQQLLQQEITLLRQEMNSYLLLLSRKNEALLDIKTRCEELAANKEIPPKNFTQTIDRLLEQDDYWESFLQKFNRTDAHFIQQLAICAPDISPAELRLAVLIRLGMDNKAIANLLHISAEGVKKSRYRLRKKLNLEQDDNLDKYLMEL